MRSEGPEPHPRPTRASRRWRFSVALLVLVVAVALAGPRAAVEERWSEPRVGPDAAAYLAREEATVSGIRARDRKTVRWADPATRARTRLAVAYLHGFSADRHEVEPFVSRLADALGANAYFTRLAGHGRDGRAMAEASAEDWLDDAAEAMAVASAVGDRVVLVGTSTGATLSAWAAGRPEVDGRLAAVVLLSPNFHPADRSSRILLWPWGGALARLVVGPERCFDAVSAAQERHWTTCYPTSALVPMMALVERVRTMPLDGIDAPTLVVYSRRDEVVDATETERVFAVNPVVQLVPFEDGSDPSHHVLAGEVMSPGSTDELLALVLDFLARHDLP